MPWTFRKEHWLRNIFVSSNTADFGLVRKLKDVGRGSGPPEGNKTEVLRELNPGYFLLPYYILSSLAELVSHPHTEMTWLCMCVGGLSIC